MTKIIDMKKYQKREKIDRILLYCVDNKMETRYITAEFCEKGKKCGNGKYYYDNGKIEADYNYKNDKRHGICKEYHYNGKIRSECEYKDGKKHGIEKRYYNNGQLSYERHYKNGLRDSWSISYEEKTVKYNIKYFSVKEKL